MATSCIFVILLTQFAITSATRDSSGSALSISADAQGIDTKAADTVRALDTNGNGKVDTAEITTFAKSQGLSSQEVLADFQELDLNKDGELDSSEIGGLLGDTGSEAETTQSNQAVEKTVAPQEAVAKPVAPLQSKKVSASNSPALRPQKDQEPKAVAGEVLQKVPAAPAENGAVNSEGKPQQAPSAIGLDLVVLEHDVEQQAGNVMAGRLAQRAQVLLARSAADEHKAEGFDAEVRSLRGNVTTLVREVNAETRNTARETASNVAKKSLAQLDKLQAQEHKSEVTAAEHREQARQAMERVRKAQASLHDK
jgi:hypothetical protein